MNLSIRKLSGSCQEECQVDYIFNNSIELFFKVKFIKINTVAVPVWPSPSHSTPGQRRQDRYAKVEPFVPSSSEYPPFFRLTSVA